MINKTFKRVLALAPSPVFAAFGLASVFTATPICSTVFYPEMTVMWFLMATAHTLPWIQWYENRQHAYSQSTLPDKQQ